MELHHPTTIDVYLSSVFKVRSYSFTSPKSADFSLRFNLIDGLGMSDMMLLIWCFLLIFFFQRKLTEPIIDLIKIFLAELEVWGPSIQFPNAIVTHGSNHRFGQHCDQGDISPNGLFCFLILKYFERRHIRTERFNMASAGLILDSVVT